MSVTLRVRNPSPCNEREGFDPYYLSHVHLRALSKEKEVRRKRGREGERDHRKRGDGRNVKSRQRVGTVYCNVRGNSTTGLLEISVE